MKLFLVTLSFIYFFSYTLFAATNSNKIALLIANANYDDAPLSHVENDVYNLNNFLTMNGFKTIVTKDATKREMIKAIRNFSSQLEENDVALFYFGGHSASLNSMNYLIPYDASINSAANIKTEAIALKSVVEKMFNAHNNTNILLLDLNINEYSKLGDASYNNELKTYLQIKEFNYFIDFSNHSSQLVKKFIFANSSKISIKKSASTLSKRYKTHANDSTSFVFKD